MFVFLQYLGAGEDTKKLKLSLKSISLVGLASIAATFIFLKTYEHMARQGMLGEKARQIYEQQAHGALGLLIDGRSEILASIHAIMDSPIVGRGSWAK